jgi:IS605 OrfB family transposase
MVKLILTIVCKLNPSHEQTSKIDATLNAFADACNYINEIVDPKIMNNLRIQTLVYGSVREKFGLSANLAIRAINRVAGNRKTAKKDNKSVQSFKPTSVDYDTRIFSFREKDWTASLTVVGGRERFNLHVGNYQIGKLKGQKPTSATLSKRANGTYTLNIQVKSDPPKVKATSKTLGCDLGRSDICHTSDGDKWSGKKIAQIRDHYSKLRAILQKKAAKGTRSSRRACRKLLKRLSGREKRFQSWVNHNISRQLVNKAATNGQALVLEDLTGIRDRTNKQWRGRLERRRSNSWAFYQLRTCLIYKSLMAGVDLLLVNPAYTSRTCHKCLHIHPDPDESYRHGKRFICGNPACLWKGDADLNGAKNIAALGLSVSQPGNPSYLCCNLSIDSSGLLKSSSSSTSYRQVDKGESFTHQSVVTFGKIHGENLLS